MGCGPVKVRKSILWSPPPIGLFKFNVDGDARKKPGPAGIGAGYFKIAIGTFYLCFSNMWGIVTLLKLRF